MEPHLEAVAAPVFVRVNDDLLLDAGVMEPVDGIQGACLVRPPSKTMFHQLLEYLEGKPAPQRLPSGTHLGRQGVVATAVTVRWGSWFAVLADRAKPVWREARRSGASRISDGEMARINVEASAALEEWINLLRQDPVHHERLVAKAVCYLPMRRGDATLEHSALWPLADPALARQLIDATPADQVAQARVQVGEHPTRTLANAIINVAWRNGPVEDVHAGEFRGYPLALRRVTPADERLIMQTTARRLALGLAACERLATEQPPRLWADQVLPYALGRMMQVTPSGWSMTESSRSLRLPGPPPGPAITS